MSELDSAIKLMDEHYDVVRNEYNFDEGDLQMLYHLLKTAKSTKDEKVPRLRIDVLDKWKFDGGEIRVVKCYENGQQIEGIKELKLECDTESLPRISITRELR